MVLDDAAHRIIAQSADVGRPEGGRCLQMLLAPVFPYFQAFDTGRLEDAYRPDQELQAFQEAAMAMALSSAITFMAHCMTISGMTGLTLPGMMELPC